MARINNLTATVPDVLATMAGSNPGALTVCLQIMKNGSLIDPDGAMGGLGLILLLDTFGIYEHRIWMLYKDVCKQDLTKTIALLRLCQMGMLSQSVLTHAIDNRGDGINVDDGITKLQTRLPNFGRTKQAELQEEPAAES